MPTAMQGEKADACIKFFVSIRLFTFRNRCRHLGTRYRDSPAQLRDWKAVVCIEFGAVIGWGTCSSSLVFWRVLPRALMDDQTKVCSKSRHVVGLTQDMIVSVLPFRFGL